MSVLVTTRSTAPPDNADRDAIATMRHEFGSHRLGRSTKPERYPVIGAAALDAMAAIAGPASASDHERAWRAAFDLVVGAMLAGAGDEALAVVA